MVHYGPAAKVLAQRPSRLCPRCGNHRTEIIGMSKDGKTSFIRCTACGSHSEIPAHDAAAAAAPAG